MGAPVKRALVILAVIAVLAAAGTAVGVWQLSKSHGERLPQISAYSHGHLTRVGPFWYCPVLNLNDCHEFGAIGELPVTEDNPIQLSVPAEIGRAPWWLLQVYENQRDSTVSYFAPNTRLAVTIPTVDPHRGRLTGVAVQLMTRIVLDGKEADVEHAEWSVRTVWPDVS